MFISVIQQKFALLNANFAKNRRLPGYGLPGIIPLHIANHEITISSTPGPDQRLMNPQMIQNTRHHCIHKRFHAVRP